MFAPHILGSFWARVDRRGETDCWPWLASTDRQGRGKFWFAGSGKHVPAPRFALMVATAQQPERTIFACHTCDNPSCCNPAHLWWGDRAANMRDCGTKGRHGFQTKYRGSANPQARLTERDVQDIRRRYADGQRPGVIGKDYGIHSRSVWKIATGRSWSHVQ